MNPRAGFIGLAAILAGCAYVSEDDARARVHRVPLGEEDGGDASAPPDASSAEAGLGPSVPGCDLTKPFHAPVLVAGFDDRDVYSARLSANEATAYLSVASGVPSSGVDLYLASRATPSAPFIIGSPISELNGSEDEYWPSPSTDEKMIFFESAMPLTPGGARVPRIWTATRPSASGSFRAPFVLGVFLVDSSEAAPYFHPSGHRIYFASTARGGAGDFDLFAADVTDFGVVTGVRSITSANTSGEEMMPVASYDDRALFFTRPQGPGTSLRNVWVVGRSKTTDPFGIPQQVVEVSSIYDEYPSAVSPDGCRLYLISDRPIDGVQRYRVWVAQKP